jgi:hypothetical protein
LKEKKMSVRRQNFHMHIETNWLVDFVDPAMRAGGNNVDETEEVVYNVHNLEPVYDKLAAKEPVKRKRRVSLGQRLGLGKRAR